MKRRDFVKAGLAGSALAVGGLPLSMSIRERSICILLDPSDPIARSDSVAWAAEQLYIRLVESGIPVRRIDTIGRAGDDDLCIVASSTASSLAVSLLSASSLATQPNEAQQFAASSARSTDNRLPVKPESLALFKTGLMGREVIAALGADRRGLIYALLDLTDWIRHSGPTGLEDAVEDAIIDQPINTVRGVMKQFTSESLDKPWFYDREGWPHYLTMLATHRFNRFHLALGFGYDSLQRIEDSYLLFCYPFLLSVPGYDVRMSALPDAERDRNLETLRFISEETVARGLEFQLGIWTHGYEFPNSPRVQHRVVGLTDESHAAYCRDALTAVLRACPAISSVALRIHGESGIAEGSYDFWATVFDGVPRAGRTVEIDLHAKGIDQRMIDNALATGMPVNLSPKLHAEHMGMPYHQTTIREWEMPEPGQVGSGLMTMSEGQRSFTRYGYADLMTYGRKHTVRHRVFSGTQRYLAWGDAPAAAAYARAYTFCGSAGMDLMEPLTCRGRRGTGVGTRIGYADTSLAPRWDWEKYLAWYRTMGRMAYHPKTEAGVFGREFVGKGGEGMRQRAGDTPGAEQGAGRLAAAGRAQHLETSLMHASRILPIVTTAHLPSAACDAYWPEMYWNQPIVEESRPNPYFDTPVPTTFQNVGAIDPELFLSMSDFARELMDGSRSGKYSPVEVASWLESHAEAARRELALAGNQTTQNGRRLAIDISMQVSLGLFFASKFRSGVLFSIYEQTNDSRALGPAIMAYREARSAWKALSVVSEQVYEPDLSASDRISERGHWADRIGRIDEDIAKMEALVSSAATGDDSRVERAIAAALTKAKRGAPPCSHKSPADFRPGEAVFVSIEVEAGASLQEAVLHYRHVNQAERFQRARMELQNGILRATIPASYTDSPYPLQYYFVVKTAPDKAWIVPGFEANLLNQPYVVLERA